MDEKQTGASLRHVTEQFRRQLTSALVMVGAARVTLAAVLLFAVGMSVDWVFQISKGWRVLPLLVFFAALGWLVYISILRPLRSRWSDKQLLAWMDRLKTSSSSMLLDRYELLNAEGIEERNDPEGKRLLEQAISAISTTPDTDAMVRQSFQGKATKHWMMGAAAALAVVILASFLFPSHMGVGATRFFNPFSSVRWPHRTNIAVTAPDGGWNIPQGEALTVRATVSGVEIPRELNLFYRVLAKGHWVRERIAVNDAKTAAYKFPEIREPLEFYLSGGDDTTDKYKVQITRRPSLEKIVVKIKNPSYSGIPSRTKEGGDVEGLEGARATIEFTCSTPLKSALFTFEGEKEQVLPVNNRTFTKEFMLTKSTAYTVKLIGESGFREARPERYEVRVRPDDPPEAEIVQPEREIEGTANAAYKVRFNASDDFELVKVEFMCRMDHGPLLALSDRITGPIPVHCKKSTGAFAWNLSQLNFTNKDVIILDYFVRATDSNPTGRGVTESAHHHIRVLKPSLYRESLLVTAKSLVNEALLAEKNQRLAYMAGKKFVASGTGEENDPVWESMTMAQTSAFDAARAMSTQLSILLENAGANRIQAEFMTARLSQIAENLRGVLENQHASIAKQLDNVRARDAAQSSATATKARRLEMLRVAGDTEAGQKRAALELQRILFLVFDWNDLQSAAVAGLRLYEQQDDCSRDTAAIAPVFIGKDIKDLSDSDQERLIILGKSQRVIYDAESVLEGHLEQILFKSEKQKRQSIRMPILAAYSELRNRRVKDRLLTASEAIKNNQPADILNEQKTALDALRLVKAGLEAAGAPEKLTALPLATEVADIDAEDNKKKTNVDETLPPVQLKMADIQGTDPLSTGLLNASDALRDLVRRSEYLAGHSTSNDLPRFMRLRFGRLTELATQATVNLKQVEAEAEKAKEAFIQNFVKGLEEDLTGSLRLIGEKDITPGARQISADASVALNDAVQLLASKRAVKEMKDEHDRQGGIDPFKRPYELQGADLAAAADAINGLLELRMDLQEAGRVLHRQEPVARKAGLLSTLEAARRERLRAKQQELAARLATIKGKVCSISEKNRAKITETLGDLLGQDLSAALGAAAGQEAAQATRVTQDADKIAQVVQGLRDFLDARGALAPVVVVDAPPPAQETATMTQEDYDIKVMSLPALKDRITRMPQLPAGLRDALTTSLSHEFPPEQEKFLAAYINAILSAAKEEKP